MITTHRRLPLLSQFSQPQLTALFLILLSPVFGPDLLGQKLIDIYTAKKGQTLQISAPHQRGLAVTRDQSIWAAVRVLSKGDSQLLILRSKDGGRKFSQQITFAKGRAHGASLVADPHRDRLHVIWSAHCLPRKFTSVYYQAIDTVAGTLIGKAELLLPGSGSNSQFYAGDLECMDDGTLALTAHSHRSPIQPGWKRGWSAGLLMRRPGAQTWQGPIIINRGYSGLCPNIHYSGSRLCFSYRCGGSKDFGIYFREYDVAQEQWVQADDVPIAFSRRSPKEIPTNASCLCLDSSGNKYILHSMNLYRGREGPDVGRLQFAYSPVRRRPNDSAWQLHRDLAPSPGERSENASSRHYALARGPGDMVNAIYSKPSDKFAKLYTRTVEHGRLVTKERVLATSRENAFTTITAFRSRQADTTLLAAVVGTTPNAPFGRVALVVQGMPIRSYWRHRKPERPATKNPKTPQTGSPPIKK